MKIRIAFIIQLTLSVAAGAQLPIKGLIAHYKCNRDLQKDSTIIYDASNNRNNGTMSGGVYYTTDRFNVGCSALWFDGNGYVNVPDSKSLQKPQSEITIAVWLKIAQDANLFKQWVTVCCKSDLSDENPGSPQYRMQATAQTISINSEFTEKIVIPMSYEVWYFYAYTFDGSKVRVYVDGRYAFEYDYTGTLTPNTMPLEIGRDLPGSLEYFQGALDDLRIYDRALAESELAQLYADQTGQSEPDHCTPIPPPAPVVVVPAPVKVHPQVQVPPPQTPQTPPVVQTPQVVRDPPVVRVPVVPVDTNPPATPPKTLSLLPDSIANIPIEYQKTVEVHSREVTIYPYDNEKEDGDIVSININGVWVRDYYELKNKKNNPSKGALIKCSLNPGDYNYFISRAWNVGSIPPNTLTIEIDDGTSVQKVLINSEVGLSGGIRIICKK